jgi:hypothetical protein
VAPLSAAWHYAVLSAPSACVLSCSGCHRQKPIYSFSLISLLWKKLKQAYVVSFLSKTWTNVYETWYVYHSTSPRLKGVIHKSLPSICMYVYLITLLGNGSALPRERIHTQQQRSCLTRRVLRSPCSLEWSRRLAVHKISWKPGPPGWESLKNWDNNIWS